MTPNRPTQDLQSLDALLAMWRRGDLSLNEFILPARQQNALLEALPPHFSPLWDDLLNRLEAGAGFSEESCSFSQQALADALALWIKKAGKHLESPQP